MGEREAADTITDLKHLSGLVNRYHTRVLLEDGAGRKWTVTSTHVVGGSTDDPGLVLKIEPIFDNRLQEKNRWQLLDLLRGLEGNAGDVELAHERADAALVEYIRDPEIERAYNGIIKWYA